MITPSAPACAAWKAWSGVPIPKPRATGTVVWAWAWAWARAIRAPKVSDRADRSPVVPVSETA